MQQYSGQPEEEQLAAMGERLIATEEQTEETCNDLMKKTEDDGEITEAMSNGKVADVFSELNSAIESLSKSNQELKIKESAIESLKFELEKAQKLETKMAEKDALLEKLKRELSKLESEVDKGKESELEGAMSLEESKLEVTNLHDEGDKLGGSPGKESNDNDNDDKSSFQEELESLKSELQSAKENLARAREDGERAETKIGELMKEIELLKAEFKQAIEAEENNKKAMNDKLQLAEENLARAREDGERAETKIGELMKEMELLKIEWKQATQAEENSKKAMDDLAIALHEVVTESNQTKENLVAKQNDIENMKKESEELKEKFKNSEMQQKALLEEARKEAELNRNIVDRLRLEADESIQAWNGKETGFVECIRKAEEEKTTAIEENAKLAEALTEAEKINETAKEETQKLRDILKQALNEANVTKEALEIARTENSELQDLLAEKDDALVFITRENENLRTNESAAAENIKELKKLLSEASGKEWKPEDKLKPQNSTEHPKERKLSNAFSINLKDFFSHTLYHTHDQDQKIEEKGNEREDDEDSENGDPLKGSILDVIDSPVASLTHRHNHHHRRKSSIFGGEDVDAINPDDLEHLDGDHIEDLENEKNPKKKKALLRRFGDIITRRRSATHRRESSVGGENHSKKDLSSAVNEANNKKEATSPGAGGDHGQSSEPAPAGENHKDSSD